MDRAGPAIGHQRESARIVAALQGGLADQVGHLSIDDPANAGCGGDYVTVEQRNRDMLFDCGSGTLVAERHLATEKSVGRNVAQHEVGIRYRRLSPPKP